MDSAFLLSPLGPIELISAGDGISSILFHKIMPEENPIPPSLLPAVTQLSEYFSGSRKEFSLQLSPVSTEFQKQVWKELATIPFGQKVTYLDIARKLGDKHLTRAVGSANGKNPIAIVIPCHRVIGESGKLTGYAGGLWRKEWLLNFESPYSQESLF